MRLTARNKLSVCNGKVILLFLVQFAFSNNIFCQVTSQVAGNYSNNGTWIGPAPDATNDDVLIVHAVVMDDDIVIEQNFEISGGGSLTGTAGKKIEVKSTGNLVAGSINIDGELLVSNDATVTFNSGDTIYIEDFELKNNTVVTIQTGAVVYVNNDFSIQNNAILNLNGELHITNCLKAKNNANIQGTGILFAGSCTQITNGAEIFGTTAECTDCIYSNGCVYNGPTVWNGSTNTDWFTNANWSEGVPDEKTPAEIATGGTFMPVINAGTASCFHLTISPGATLTISGTNDLDIHGNLEIQGSFVANKSSLNFIGTCWATKIKSTGVVQFHSVVVNNPNDVEVIAGAYDLIGIMTIQGGSFITNDSLTVISNAAGTGSISEITGVGISGQIEMQRYIDAGETYWRYFGSAVQGATLAQFNDDFATAGYPGSWFPNFGWVSAYNYDETLGAGLGYLPATGISQAMGVGEGWQIWCGDTITGTQPFNFDFRGNVNQGNIFLPVTYTNTGNPSEDGFNLVSNPYPSTIDWDDADWTKSNMANAVYIQNPDNQQYATYVAGASTNGGSQFIASQQAFWVQAIAASPVLMASEGVKSNTDQAFLKSATNNPGMKIILQGNQEFDEVILRHMDIATENFDDQFDAKKYWGGWGLYPQLSLLNDSGLDFTIQSFDKANTEWQIPLRAVVFQSGVYNIEFDNISSLDVPCMQLEDTYTGSYYDIIEGTPLPFFLSDTTYSARFVLHIGRNYDLTTVDVSCHGDVNGAVNLDLEQGGTYNYSLTKDGITTNANSSINPLSLNGLESGIYNINIAGFSDFCGTNAFNFVINSPAPLMSSPQIQQEAFGGDGSVHPNISGGTNPYTYSWSNGSINSSLTNLMTGTYELNLTDANGCNLVESYFVNSTVSIDNLESNFSVFYSSTENQIVINNWNIENDCILNLYSSDGKLLKSYNFDAGTTNSIIQLNDLASGIYLLNGPFPSESFKFKR